MEDGQQYIRLDAYLRNGISQLWQETRRQGALIDSLMSNLSSARSDIADLQKTLEDMQAPTTPERKLALEPTLVPVQKARKRKRKLVMD